MNFYNIILVTLLFCWPNLYGQQDAQYTHYMYNMGVVNPAYTTENVMSLNAGLFFRKQWSGIDGSPLTKNMFLRSPLTDKVTVGFNFEDDEIGNIEKRQFITGDFAYTIRVGEESTLSLGIKSGVTWFKANFQNLNLNSGSEISDVAFSNNIKDSYFNMGVGAFYVWNNFYLGLSSPNVISHERMSIEDVQTNSINKTHLYLNTGYVYKMSDNLWLKPSVLVKNQIGTPISLDASLNVLLNKRFEAGAAYRLGDSVSGLLNYLITKGVRIGYTYDYVISRLASFTGGSHELMLLFDINLFGLGKGYDKSPRFF